MDNSQAGSINETYDLFLRHGLHLVGEGPVAGSLYRCLGAFAERHLNLTKLESRPRPGRPWEYVFYADVDAAAQLPEMVEGLAALSEHATFTRLLGTYAKATPL